MAIFGSFDEIPPAEALSATGAGVGVFVARLPLHLHEIFLRGGKVVGWRENGQPLDDIMRLHARFAEIVGTRVGTFQFRRLPAEQVVGPFEVPLQQILASGLAHHEEAEQADTLPSVQTVFERVEQREAWLGEELQVFWERAEIRVRAGASAESLAPIAGTSVAKAQQYLHRLRLAGLVRPRRLPVQAAPALSTPPPARPEFPALPVSAEPAASLADVRPMLPPKPLVRRLMDGLARLFR